MPLPALNRMFITSAWLQSIIYGINCVLFGVCIYAISIRRTRAHWIIPLSCIFHFSIATASCIVCLLYALQGLTNPAIISVPDGSTLYFARVTAFSSTMIGLYTFDVLVLHFLLIWRFYLVWDRNLILVILMIILEIGHLSTAFAAWGVVTHFGVVFLSASNALAKSLCVLNLVLTICLTSGIAYRLWRAGKNTFDLTGYNAYKPAIYTIIQCGAIYTISIVVVCALQLSGNPAGLMATHVGVQFATLTPLLLITDINLRVTRREHDDDPPDTVEPTFARPVEVNITEEIHTHPRETCDPMNP
ncbi:uncharacterized protein EDB93DRAFT_211554 [Suillus bovinus]|uniref:uncharacterized protein n=1 Tax=Suillus bovinus TaxID=48563 RepID=UPI001B85D593|nr:uncharacterized protein EDB93DRAFT_211554 [Suillus bovinus]KAG2153728.1 hypothetical protein EDB93DRAFT_211554 [Suillus bovinus]